jgi:hypothetical protein
VDEQKDLESYGMIEGVDHSAAVVQAAFRGRAVRRMQKAKASTGHTAPVVAAFDHPHPRGKEASIHPLSPLSSSPSLSSRLNLAPSLLPPLRSQS